MRLSWLLKVSVLAALSAILMHLSFPIFPAHPYLRYDPSEVPALIATFALGPLAGVAVVLLKNALYLMLHFSPGELIGIPMNSLAGCTLAGVAGHVYRLRKRKSIAVVALALGALAMTLVMIPANLVLLPIFQRFFMPSTEAMPQEALLGLILGAVTPFNLVKGGLTGFLTFLVYKRVSPLLKAVPRWEHPPASSGRTGM